MDTKTIMAGAALVAAIAGPAGTYAVMQERVRVLDERVQALEQDDDVAERLRSLRCFIAKLHDAPQPECS